MLSLVMGLDQRIDMDAVHERADSHASIKIRDKIGQLQADVGTTWARLSR